MKKYGDKGSPSKTTSWAKAGPYPPIKKHSKLDRANTLHKQMDYLVTKSIGSKNFIQETPFHSIICLLEIKFYSKIAPLPLHELEAMNHLLSQNHVLCDPSVRHKSNLGRINKFVLQGSQSRYKNFGNYLVAKIT